MNPQEHELAFESSSYLHVAVDACAHTEAYITIPLWRLGQCRMLPKKIMFYDNVMLYYAIELCIAFM